MDTAGKQHTIDEPATAKEPDTTRGIEEGVPEDGAALSTRKKGNVTVGTPGMLGRGFDAVVDADVNNLGGVHAHMLGRSANPDTDAQCAARAGRNERNGSYRFNNTINGDLYSQTHNTHAKMAIMHYKTAAAEHAQAVRDHTKATRAVDTLDPTQSANADSAAIAAARAKVDATAADITTAQQKIHTAEQQLHNLTPTLQNEAAEQARLERANRRANQPHTPPATTPHHPNAPPAADSPRTSHTPGQAQRPPQPIPALPFTAQAFDPVTAQQQQLDQLGTTLRHQEPPTTATNQPAAQTTNATTSETPSGTPAWQSTAAPGRSDTSAASTPAPTHAAAPVPSRPIVATNSAFLSRASDTFQDESWVARPPGSRHDPAMVTAVDPDNPIGPSARVPHQEPAAHNQLDTNGHNETHASADQSSVSAVPATGGPRSAPAISGETTRAGSPHINDGVPTDSTDAPRQPPTSDSPDEWPTDDMIALVSLARQGNRSAAQTLNRRLERATAQRVSAALGWDPASGIPPEPVRRLASTISIIAVHAAERGRWAVPPGLDIGDWLFEAARNTLHDNFAQFTVGQRQLRTDAADSARHRVALTDRQAAEIDRLTRQVWARAEESASPEHTGYEPIDPRAYTADDPLRIQFGTEVFRRALATVKGRTEYSELEIDDEQQLALEITDQVFRTAGHRFRATPEAEIGRLLAIVCGNTIHDHLESARLLQRILHALPEKVRTGRHGRHLARADRPELRRRLAALEEANPTQYRCLVLRHVRGLSPMETAEAMGCGVSVVDAMEYYAAHAIAEVPAAQIPSYQETPHDNAAPTVGDRTSTDDSAESSEATSTGKRKDRDLTDHEIRVLARMATGGENAEIAQDLDVSVNVIKTNVKNILRLLGVGNRTQAVAAALRRRILDINDIPQPKSRPPRPLLPQELAILDLVAEGAKDDAIARATGVDTKSIRAALDRHFLEFGVRDRTAAVVEAFRRGDLYLDPVPAPGTPLDSVIENPHPADEIVDDTSTPAQPTIPPTPTTEIDRSEASHRSRPSDRERQVLRLLAQGLSATEVGAALSLSPRTVHSYLERTGQKFHTSGMIPTILAAARAGQLDDDTEPLEPVELSGDEAEVVQLVALGRTNRAIATVVGSDRVTPLLAQLYERLGVDTRVGLALAAQRRGLLAGSDPGPIDMPKRTSNAAARHTGPAAARVGSPTGPAAATSPDPAALQQLRTELRRARVPAETTELAQLLDVDPSLLRPGPMLLALYTIQQQIRGARMAPPAVAAVAEPITRWIRSWLELHEVTETATRQGAQVIRADPVVQRDLANRNKQLITQLVRALGLSRQGPIGHTPEADPLTVLRQVVDATGSPAISRLIDMVAAFLANYDSAEAARTFDVVQVRAIRRRLADALACAPHEVDRAQLLALGLSPAEVDRTPTRSDIAELAGVRETFVDQVLDSDEPTYSEPAQRVLIAAQWLDCLDSFEDVVDPAFVDQRFVAPRIVDGTFAPVRFRPQPRMTDVANSIGMPPSTFSRALRGVGSPGRVRQARAAADELDHWYHQTGPTSTEALGRNPDVRTYTDERGLHSDAEPTPAPANGSTLSKAAAGAPSGVTTAARIPSAPDLPESPVPRPDAEAEKYVKQAIAADLFLTYGIEVLGLDQPTISIDTAMSIRNAIVDELAQNGPVRIDAIIVAPLENGTYAAAGKILDGPEHIVFLNKTYFGHPENFRDEFERKVAARWLNGPTGNPAYDLIRHEIAHLRDPHHLSKSPDPPYADLVAKRTAGTLHPDARFDRRRDYTGWLEAKAFGFLYTHFAGLKQAGAIPAETRFNDWLDLLNGYSRELKQPDDDSRRRIFSDAEKNTLGVAEPALGDRPVFNPRETLAEANNAFGNSAPDDFTHPVYALQALMRGVPVARVWRDAKQRNDQVAERAEDRGPVPAASGFQASMRPDGVLVGLSRRWGDLDPDQQHAQKTETPVLMAVGRDGRLSFGLDELVHLVDRQLAEMWGANSRSHESDSGEPLSGFSEWDCAPAGELAQRLRVVSEMSWERAELLRGVRQALAAPDGPAELLGLGAWAETGAAQAYLDIADLRTRVQQALSRPDIGDRARAQLHALSSHIDAITLQCGYLDTALATARARAEQLAVGYVATARGGLALGPYGRIVDGDRVELFEGRDQPSAATEMLRNMLRQQGIPVVTRRVRVDPTGRVLVEDLPESVRTSIAHRQDRLWRLGTRTTDTQPLPAPESPWQPGTTNQLPQALPAWGARITDAQRKLARTAAVRQRLFPAPVDPDRMTAADTTRQRTLLARLEMLTEYLDTISVQAAAAAAEQCSDLLPGQRFGHWARLDGSLLTVVAPVADPDQILPQRTREALAQAGIRIAYRHVRVDSQGRAWTTELIPADPIQLSAPTVDQSARSLIDSAVEYLDQRLGRYGVTHASGDPIPLPELLDNRDNLVAERERARIARDRWRAERARLSTARNATESAAYEAATENAALFEREFDRLDSEVARLTRLAFDSAAPTRRAGRDLARRMLRSDARTQGLVGTARTPDLLQAISDQLVSHLQAVSQQLMADLDQPVPDEVFDRDMALAAMLENINDHRNTRSQDPDNTDPPVDTTPQPEIGTHSAFARAAARQTLEPTPRQRNPTEAEPVELAPADAAPHGADKSAPTPWQKSVSPQGPQPSDGVRPDQALDIVGGRPSNFSEPPRGDRSDALDVLHAYGRDRRGHAHRPPGGGRHIRSANDGGTPWSALKRSTDKRFRHTRETPTATPATESNAIDIEPVLPDRAQALVDRLGLSPVQLRQLAGGAIVLLRDHLGPDATLLSLTTPMDPDDVARASAARAHAVARWWNSLTHPQQAALILRHPHQIGNADGVPYSVRDEANRRSIIDDIKGFLKRKDNADHTGLLAEVRTPLGLGQRGRALSPEQKVHLTNLVRTIQNLAALERDVREFGSPPVQLIAFEAAAYDGDGRIIVSIDDADEAAIVTRQLGGVGNTLLKLPKRVQAGIAQYVESARHNPGVPTATIIDIGFHHPNTIEEIRSSELAEQGGYIVAADIAAYDATRTAWANLPGGAARPRLRTVVAHSYGSTTLCYAGIGGRLAAHLDQVVLTGSPGAGPMAHADEFGIGADNVFAVADDRDPVTKAGGATPEPTDRYFGFTHGSNPVGPWGAVRLTAAMPSTVRSVKRIHGGYLIYLKPRQPTISLRNVALVCAGRADLAERAPHRRAADPIGRLRDLRWWRANETALAVVMGDDEPEGAAEANRLADNGTRLVVGPPALPATWSPWRRPGVGELDRAPARAGAVSDLAAALDLPEGKRPAASGIDRDALEALRERRRTGVVFAADPNLGDDAHAFKPTGSQPNPPAEEPVSLRQLLSTNKPYRRLYISNALTGVGDNVQRSALPLLTLDLTDSPMAAGLTSFALFLPQVLFELPAGYIADFHDRRRTMLLAQAVGLTSTAATGAMVLFGASDLGTALAAATLVEGTAAVFYLRSLRSTVLDLVTSAQRPRANRLSEIEVGIATTGGRALGPILLDAAKSLPFITNGATYGWNLATLFRMRDSFPPHASADSHRFGDSLRRMGEGLRTVWREPFLREYSGLTMLTNASFAALNLRTAAVLDAASAPGLAAGAVLAASGAGGVVGGLLPVRFIEKVRADVVYPAQLAGFAGVAALQAVSTDPIAIAAGAFGVAALGVSMNARVAAYDQAVLQPSLYGRATSAKSMFLGAGPAIGGLLGGAVLSSQGITPAGWIPVAIVGAAAAGAAIRRLVNRGRGLLGFRWRRDEAAPASTAEPIPEPVSEAQRALPDHADSFTRGRAGTDRDFAAAAHAYLSDLITVARHHLTHADDRAAGLDLLSRITDVLSVVDTRLALGQAPGTAHHELRQLHSELTALLDDAAQDRGDEISDFASSRLAPATPGTTALDRTLTRLHRVGHPFGDCITRVSRAAWALGVDNGVQPVPGENDWEALEDAVTAQLTPVYLPSTPTAGDPLASIVEAVRNRHNRTDSAVVLVDDGTEMHSYLVTEVDGEVVVFDTNVEDLDSDEPSTPRVRTHDKWTQSFTHIEEAFVAYLKSGDNKLIARDEPIPDAARSFPRRGPITGPPADADVAANEMQPAPATGEQHESTSSGTARTEPEPEVQESPRTFTAEELETIADLKRQLLEIEPKAFGYIRDLPLPEPGEPFGAEWVSNRGAWFDALFSDEVEKLREVELTEKDYLELGRILERFPVYITLTLLVATGLKVEQLLHLPRTSPGSLFFKQVKRVQGDRTTIVYKFRTMPEDEQEKPSNRDTADRISRGQQFVRDTSLDELPQLLAIARGRMQYYSGRPMLDGDRERMRRVLTPDEFAFWDAHPKDDLWSALHFPGCRALDPDSDEYLRSRYLAARLWSMIGSRRAEEYMMQVVDRYLLGILPGKLRELVWGTGTDVLAGVGHILGRIGSWTQRMALSVFPDPDASAAAVTDGPADDRAPVPARGAMPPGADTMAAALGISPQRAREIWVDQAIAPVHGGANPMVLTGFGPEDAGRRD
ncbi:MFS transporter [Nocardia pseudovaccinii]|uniref:MFS transporter n=1 Tax=Nocardia pseudovaccinii TaxID=189540 RepID=UPI0007A3C7A7|nr:MFS transporter [Nocardia pseudovaccinii]